MARKIKTVATEIPTELPPPSITRGLTHKMTDYEKNLMFEYLARGYSCVQVTQALKEYDGIDISVNNVKYYKKTYPDEINERRSVRAKKLSKDLRIDKEGRLERLVNVLEEMEDNGLVLATDKNGKLVNLKEYTDLLRQIGSEVGDVIEVKEYRHTIAIANLEPGFWDDNKPMIQEKALQLDSGKGKKNGKQEKAREDLLVSEGSVITEGEVIMDYESI